MMEASLTGGVRVGRRGGLAFTDMDSNSGMGAFCKSAIRWRMPNAGYWFFGFCLFFAAAQAGGGGLKAPRKANAQ